MPAQIFRLSVTALEENIIARNTNSNCIIDTDFIVTFLSAL